MTSKATYLMRRATAVAAYFRGWRGALVGAALLLGAAGFFAGGWAVLLFAAASVPVLALLGVMGARITSNHDRIAALEAQLAAASPLAPGTPTTTLVVTTHDEVDTVHDRLAAIQARLGEGGQVVVVDDLSTDGTAEAAFDGFGADPRFVIAQTTARLGPAAAGRIGAALARGGRVELAGGGQPAAGSVPGGFRRLVEVRHEPLPADPAAAVAGRMLLFPSAAYHVDEVGPLAERLVGRGIPPLIMVSDARWEGTRRALRRFGGLPVYRTPEPGPWLDGVAGVLTFNDWGEVEKDHVAWCNERGIPTFGKVEGAQDFADADTGRRRHAYQTVRHVLCQGENDVLGVPTGIKHVVGSSRLEAIWLAPPRQEGEELAVLNLNFTYGVLEEARELWLSTAIEGCERAGIPYVVSMHPAERNRPDAPVSPYPMKHLLTKASVLISRFSTVPFEAMARGVPFVYHNPHREQVPAFQEPDGAFEVSYGAADLAAALDDARKWTDTYRERCAPFFLAQVDVDPARPAAERGAAAIAGVVAAG